MTHPESLTVRDYVRDMAVGNGMTFIPGSQLDRTPGAALLAGSVRDALIRLNSEIAAKPDRAAEVLYRLNTIIADVKHSAVVRQNELFAAWLREEHSMPFGPDGAHTSVRLIDFDEPANNEWIVSTEVVFRQGHVERRFDLVIWCNGMPIVIGEAKAANRPSFSWLDAAGQIHGDYEKNVPMFFVPNVLSFGTDGKDLRYGTVGMPDHIWGPWRDGDELPQVNLTGVGESAAAVLAPEALLRFMQHYTLFATDGKQRRIKIIARYQQFQAADLIVDRVVEGLIKKGLVWHFQGSGKSLLMVFTSMRLREHPDLGSPTVFIVVDRIDLDTQITGTFSATDVPNTISVNSRSELEKLVKAGSRKVVITTIHKFAELPAGLDNRDNIIVLVDEAHRTQEGQLASAMRAALPNAFFFGLSGTPINTRDRNTFRLFGAEEDSGHYLSRYSFEDSIRDGATLPLHFQPRTTEINIDQEAIDEGFDELAAQGELDETQRTQLSKRAASAERLIKAPGRIGIIAADIATHFTENVDPLGFKAQLVAFDKEACVLYKEALDQHLPPEASAVVMSMDARDPQDWKDRFGIDRAAEEKLLDRYRDPADPLKILIVTAKLLTGFDAPIMQTQYLDKPIKDHTLLQAICRTNRTYPGKTHGLIVDYLGIFDNMADALDFDENNIGNVVTNIEALWQQFPVELDKALGFFPNVDRTDDSYTGLIAAQEAIPTDEKRDLFAAQYSVVNRLWEALSPDQRLLPHTWDYRWLTSVYESVRPVDLTGRMVWRRLGAKTLELINQNVTVEVPRLDLEAIVLNADLLAELASGNAQGKAKEIERAITTRLARHLGNPEFVALGLRLERLKERYAEGQQDSLDFLRGLLDIATDTVAAERKVEALTPQERAKNALTELFQAVKTDETPIMVEKVVNDIDSVVTERRYEGWQDNSEGRREIRAAMRMVLWRYKIRDEDVYEKAVTYVKDYY